jgi:hypothetical protein
MTPPITAVPGDDACLVVGYRLLDDGRPPYVTACRWLALASALSAWPGAPMTVERRLVTPALDALTAEVIVVTVQGAGIVATVEELERDVSHLMRPLLAGVRYARLRGREALGIARLTFDVHEIARLDVVPRPIDPLSGSAAEGMAAALRALSEGCGIGAIGCSIGTPPALAAQVGDVRCELTVMADTAIPHAVLAHVAAGARAGPDAWRRRRPKALRDRGAEAATLGELGRGHLVSPRTAVLAAIVPVDPEALRIGGGPGRPAAEMPIVQALSGEPFGLSANLLRTGAVLLGDPDERAIVLRRAISVAVRRGRRVLWLDLTRGAIPTPRPLPAAADVVEDLLSSPGRAIFLPLAHPYRDRCGVARLLQAILETPWPVGDEPSVFVDGAEILVPGDRLGKLLDRQRESPVELAIGLRAGDGVLRCLGRRARSPLPDETIAWPDDIR